MTGYSPFANADKRGGQGNGLRTQDEREKGGGIELC